MRERYAPARDVLNHPKTDEDHRTAFERILERMPPAVRAQFPSFEEFLSKKRDEEEQRPAIQEQITQQQTEKFLELWSNTNQTYNGNGESPSEGLGQRGCNHWHLRSSRTRGAPQQRSCLLRFRRALRL
jgi:hypothetical protein